MVVGTRTSQRDAVVRRAWFGYRRGSWKRGIIVLHHGGDIINESATRSTVAEVARPRVWCLRRGDESEEESNGGCGVAPRALCFRGGDCEVACVRFGFGGSTLPDDVQCCNGTIAAGPAWRWSSRCDAVRSSRFPIDLGP